MIAEIIGISIDLILIAVIIFFIVKGVRQRTVNSKWPKTLIISGIIGIIAIPSLIFSIVNASAVLATPVPNIFIPSTEVKITGKHTKGVLKGRTTPNTLVTLKEDVDKDEDPITKKTYSSNSGKFEFKNLEDDMDYKLSAKNKYHKSKVIKVSVGDIPDAAYTQLNVTGADDGFLTVKSDDSNKVTVSGTGTKNSNITVQNGNYDTVQTVAIDKNGKWSLTLDGPTKKKAKDYTLTAQIPGLLESDDVYVTVKNPNYVKPTKESANNQQSTTNNDSEKNEQTDSSNSKTGTSGKTKQSKSESEQGFVDDMNTYLSNKYPEVSFTYTDGEANFVVPDEVAYLKKNAMKAYVQPLYDRVELFSNANNLKDTPTFLVKTQSGSNIAREGLFGIKVYADK